MSLSKIQKQISRDREGVQGNKELITPQIIGEPITSPNTQCRYELKYLVSTPKALAIARFVEMYLKLDRYSKLQRDGFYPIVSMYLDSDNFQLCRESLEGHKNRFKLRIRSYSDSADSPCFFEIKRRINTIILKSRARIPREQLLDSLNGKYISKLEYNNDSKALNQFLLYLNSIKARPAARIRYMRRAYEGDTKNKVRITFDRNLFYNISDKIDISFDGSSWRKHLIECYILEIKFTGSFPFWIKDMVEYFDLCQQSVSKYATSIKDACSLGFCAPELLTGV